MNNRLLCPFFIAIFFVAINPTAFADSVSEPCIEFSKIATFHGFVPKAITTFVDNFNASKGSMLSRQEPSSLSLLLHGEPGNGKTEVARAIASATGSELIKLSGPVLVSSYQGSGARTIKETVQDIISKIEKDPTRTFILFIDEINGIASTDIPKARVDNKLAGQALWDELTDRIPQYRNNIRCIFNTNYIDKIDPQLQERCTIVYMPFATAQQRAVEIDKLFTHYNLPSCKEGLLLVRNKFQDLGCVEKNKTLWNSFLSMEILLAALDDHVHSWDGISKDVQWQTKYDNYMCSIEKELGIVEGLEPLLEQKLLQVTSLYKKLIVGYIECVKKYIATDQRKLTTKQLNTLVYGTDKFSYRSLRLLIGNIYSDNLANLTDEQIQQIIVSELKKMQECVRRGQEIARREKNKDEIDGLLKEISLVDGFRKINTRELGGRNGGEDQTVISVGANLGLANLNVSKSSHNGGIDHQAPSLQKLVQQADVERGDTLNKAVVKHIAPRVESSIRLSEFWHSLILKSEFFPLAKFFKTTRIGKNIDKSIKKLLVMTESESQADIQMRINHFILNANINRIYFDPKICTLLLDSSAGELLVQNQVLFDNLTEKIKLTSIQKQWVLEIFQGEDTLQKRILATFFTLLKDDTVKLDCSITYSAFDWIEGIGHVHITLVPAK